jgi:IclR family pca regulon transcriptional regulator
MSMVETAEEAPRTERREEAAYLEALARGLGVLTAFNAERPHMTLTEVAAATGLSKQTARRVLYTLLRLGHIAQKGRHFSLTPNVFTLAGAYLKANRDPEILRPVCSWVSSRVDEPSSVAILDGVDAVMLTFALPDRPILRGPRLGLRLPAFCTAMGRVLLSGLEPIALDAFMDRLEAKAFTEYTIVDKVRLRGAIERARVQEYALADQEQDYGYRSIAVPIRRFDNAIVAALQVGLTTERASLERMEQEFLPVLRQGASELRGILL